MIFGFNTDIKHAGTVYHVQSEARQHDLLLQTQVFVRGRCIGKHATSYADKFSQPGFSDEHMHDLLKAQHKNVIEAIRNGGLDEMLGIHSPSSTGQMPAVRDDAPTPATATPKLAIEWLNAGTAYEGDAAAMKFGVRNGIGEVRGAQLTSRLNMPSEPPIYSQALTGADGTAEMRVIVDQSTLDEATVLVQAQHEGNSVTRKFRLRRTR